jgi:hypothetical protein
MNGDGQGIGAGESYTLGWGEELTMNQRLDHLVEQLATAPTDRTLEGFEAGVSRSIIAQRARARAGAALAPVGVASVGLALAIGLAAGGVTAATSAAAAPKGEAFLVASNLAPSTLLND